MINGNFRLITRIKGTLKLGFIYLFIYFSLVPSQAMHISPY